MLGRGNERKKGLHDVCVLCIRFPFSANRVKQLSHRENYGFHGFYLLLLFVYKYFVDTSFIFVSCTNVDGESVSTHDL